MNKVIGLLRLFTISLPGFGPKEHINIHWLKVCLSKGCHSLPVVSYPNSFQVSKSAPLLPNPVYIRVGGLVNNMFVGGGVGAIHPSQPTQRFVLRFINLTRSG